MDVLFFGTPGIEQPWYGDVVNALSDKHRVILFDAKKPLAQQFVGVRVVVDQQGLATRPMIDAAADAGVSFWQTLITGTDHVDVVYFQEKKIPVGYMPGVFSGIALAEHALFLILCCAKKLWVAQRSVRSKAFSYPPNEELAGKTLGLIGLGASGRELAKRAWALGMRVVGVDAVEIPADVCSEAHIEFMGTAEHLGKLLAEADYVSIHVPLTPITRHMIDQRAFAQMKRSATLINVSRGAIVDEAALLDALRTNRIKAAGLDVFATEPLDPCHPLLHFENVIVTPHHAGITDGTSRRRAQVVAENVARIAQGVPPLYLVPRV